MFVERYYVAFEMTELPVALLLGWCKLHTFTVFLADLK